MGGKFKIKEELTGKKEAKQKKNDVLFSGYQEQDVSGEYYSNDSELMPHSMTLKVVGANRFRRSKSGAVDSIICGSSKALALAWTSKQSATPVPSRTQRVNGKVARPDELFHSPMTG